MESVSRVVGTGPVASSGEPDDRPAAGTSDGPLLPIPSSSVGGTEIELAILWMRGLQEDRKSERDRSALEERRMIEAGRRRIAELRDKAQDEWSAGVARAVGGIVGGGLQVVGAVVPTRGAPSAAASAETGAKEAVATTHKVDWSDAVNGFGASFDSSAGLWGAAYARRAGEHEAEAAEREADQNVAERRADRAREAEADKDDSIERTIELLKQTLAAQNAAQNAAVRG